MHQRGFATVQTVARYFLIYVTVALTPVRAADVINVANISFDGEGGLVTLPSNLVRVRRALPTPRGLFVHKTASRDVAEPGDFVDFTIQIKNVSQGDFAGVVLHDQLPFGFVYQRGSSRLDLKRTRDPTGTGGTDLHFTIGQVLVGQTVTLTYRVLVGVGAFNGDGTNRAQAHNTIGLPAESNLASVHVELRPGVFTNRGVIIGKVFVDLNGNRIQDKGERGVPGVRIYLEDGSYVITDSEGKYSFYGVLKRTHVVKLDRTTIPPQARLESLNTRNARDGGSAFAEMRGAEMVKVNFAIVDATPEILAQIDELRDATEAKEKGEVDATLRRDLDRDGPQPLAADPKSLPSSGIIAPGVGVQATTQDRTESSDSFILGGNSRPAFPAGGAGVGLHGFSSSAIPTPGPVVPNPVLQPPNPIAASLPGVPLEQVVQTQAREGTPGFIDLKDHDTLPMAQTTIRVKGVLGGTISLLVNGREVPQSRIGKRVTVADRGIEATEFVGVELRPGDNRLEVLQRDQFGNTRGSNSIVVIAPDKLGSIRVKVPNDAFADGRTPARVVVELVDHNGVPVTARTALTLDTSLGKWLANDMNPREPGVQVFIEGGHAQLELASPVEPGESHIRVSSGAMQTDAVVSFLPELRPMIAAGVIEGKINISHLSAGALRPVNSRDTFDAELRDFAAHGNNSDYAGRAAFFLKGKILGSYLLTAAYDSERDTRERLFRDIQPDEFYPIYGDASVKGFEAQSSGELYVRIDNKKSYLLYGDFVTQTPNDVQQLGNYNRSLNGIREHYEKNNVRANAWAAYDNSRQIVEELRANGTSGPYAFRTATGIVNSEKVEILTRDRDNPGLVIKTAGMTRFTDYEFEPLTGQLLFKSPIPSLDSDLNPISIRVTYEIDQGGDRFWVYGADAQVKVGRRMEVGGAFARDENPADRYALYSGNVAFDLGMKTFLFGEFAHSVDAIEGEGNAGRVELRHSSEKLFARIFWGRANDHFKNQTAILTSGRTEGGAQISYQFTKTTRGIIQAVDTESHDFGTRRGVLAGIEQTFAGKIRLEIDGRYSTETTSPASPSTSVAGITPNDVQSIRGKLTLPLPWTQDAGRIYGEYEQDILDADKRLAAVGGDYQLSSKARLYFRHELISSLGGPFELNAVTQVNNTVFGIESTYAKDASFFNEYRVRDGISGEEAETAIGLRNRWTLADGLRAHTTFERVSPTRGASNTNEATAVTGALEYTANPDWKATTRLELRTSPTVDSLLDSFGVACKLDQNWTALAKSVVYIAKNKGPSAVDQRQARIQGGVAWRQTSEDIWNALAKYEFRTEEGAIGTFDGGTPSPLGPAVQRRVNILSADVNCQPDADWLLTFHYAGKIAFEDSSRRSDTAMAHLLATHVTRDINDRFDVGVAANALISGDGKGVQYGVGPEIGFIIAPNTRIAVGYNLLGFSDQDLTQDQYTQHGFYFALRLKFDEQLFGRRRDDER